jgi:hypothetical protein
MFHRAFPSLKSILSIVSAMLISSSIVFTSVLFFEDFFFIDDAQNAFLPFYKEIGRIWLSGHLPLLTTNIFFGGNILVDMMHSPFSPQTILTGLLANQVASFRVAANFLAWFNITLIIAGAYWLGRILTIRASYAFLFGFIVATNPVFLYVYTASWWNFASAFAWFIVSFAALLQFRLNQSAWGFVVAVLFLCFLFATAGTHMQFAYIICFSVMLVLEGYHNRSLKRLMNIVFIAVCAGLISAIPLMSEYILSSSIIVRSSAFSNVGNFLVPPWGSIINAFNPFYATYMNAFGGYSFIPFSLAYIGIISILLLFSDKKALPFPFNYQLIFFLAIILILFVFSSSNFGPMRWPFRYLPVWSMMVSMIVIFHLEKAVFNFSRTQIYRFGGLIFGATWIQLFSSESFVFKWKNIGFALLFLFLCIGLVKYFLKFKDEPKKRIGLLWFVTVIAWVGMLAKTHSLGEGGLLYNPNLTEQISGLPSEFPSRYVLGLTPNDQSKNFDATDLGSAQILLFGEKKLQSINGYSPINHIGLRKLFPSLSAHGIFIPKESLKNISQPSEVDKNIFDYQIMNIGFISAWKKDITPEISTLLVRADLKVEPYLDNNKVLIKPEKIRTVEGSLTYQSIDGSVKFEREDGMMHEWFQVKKTDVNRILIFSRVYWLGYHAVINGVEYPVSAYKNALVKVAIPAKVSGKMHLYYEPISWKYTKWSLISGIILLGFVFVRLKLASPTVIHSSGKLVKQR